MPLGKPLATVVALNRFPFKSMLGESLPRLNFTSKGAQGDRAFALRELSSHRLVTARQSPELLQHCARLGEQGVEVKLADGRSIMAEDPQLTDYFSATLGRKVGLAKAFGERDPSGLFDDSSILLASIQSLAALAKACPECAFDMRRFRANIWLDAEATTDFPEEQWLDTELRIGKQLLLKVDKPCERCVITTLPQQELSRDNRILKTIVTENSARLGVYCSIISGGIVERGDEVRLATE